jgi:hypothetical protein
MTMFENVAHHLQQQAIRERVNAAQADSFGRSAFNRYYYATFIRTRKLFAALDPAWSQLPHKDYPELLKGKIKNHFKKVQRKAVKLGDKELSAACSKAASYSFALAEMFSKSKSIRVVSDYEPEESIKFIDNGRFSLRDVNISTAHEWPKKADMFCVLIEKTWNASNV